MSALIDEAKAYLDITWDDEPTNVKLTSMISRATKRINELTGSTLDYTEEDLPKDLLLNRIAYERSGVLNEFEKDYCQEIIFLQNRERVKRAIKET